MAGIETATDSLERHKHLQAHPENRLARRVALLIGILAACLAICELAKNPSRTTTLPGRLP